MSRTTATLAAAASQLPGWAALGYPLPCLRVRSSGTPASMLCTLTQGAVADLLADWSPGRDIFSRWPPSVLQEQLLLACTLS